MSSSVDGMLTETVNEYLSGNTERNLVEEARSSINSPYSNAEPEYTLVGESYTAYFFTQGGERGVRIELESEEPFETVKEIAEKTGMKQTAEWKYRTEGAMVGLSTQPDTAILEISQDYDEDPEKLIESI